jgi:hypothetical protein
VSQRDQMYEAWFQILECHRRLCGVDLDQLDPEQREEHERNLQESWELVRSLHRARLPVALNEMTEWERRFHDLLTLIAGHAEDRGITFTAEEAAYLAELEREWSGG